MIDISRITRAEADVLRSALTLYHGEMELTLKFTHTKRDRSDAEWRLFLSRQLLDGLGPA